MSTAPPLRIALLGTGAMGRFLATHIQKRKDIELVAWWDALPAAREAFASQFRDLAELQAEPTSWAGLAITHLIEAAHPTAIPLALELAAIYKCNAILASVGGLIAPAGEAALESAKAAGIRVLVPSGAIGGLDILRAIPKEHLQTVTLRTRKPPSALPPEQAAAITEPTCLFSGTAWEAIAQFPKNVNVAVTLSLAGIGPHRTMVEVWADPTLTRNTHEIAIEAECGSYHITCANEPLPDNPGTSAIAAMSILSLLQSESSSLRIGS